MLHERSLTTISAGNRQYLKVNTGITLVGIVGGLIWIGTIWQQNKDMQHLAKETAQIAATKKELLEIAGALNALAIRQSESARTTERLDLLSQERWASIEGSLARIEKDINQIKMDRVQYRWDRGQLLQLGMR